jgi:pyruvate formate lyase activating enzyme
VAGTEYTAQELASLLNRQSAILKANEGGITFSGGEPLMQACFVAEVVDLLDGIHVLLDTSGYGSEQDMRLLLKHVDMLFFDLKIMDRAMHRRFTGCDNDKILRNLAVLGEIGVPFIVRVPLVPGVTDTDENLDAIAGAVRGLSGLIRVDLLPYNKSAGGKYRAAGIEFKPGFDEQRTLNINTTPFKKANIDVHVYE